MFTLEDYARLLNLLNMYPMTCYKRSSAVLGTGVGWDTSDGYSGWWRRCMYHDLESIIVRRPRKTWETAMEETDESRTPENDEIQLAKKSERWDPTINRSGIRRRTSTGRWAVLQSCDLSLSLQAKTNLSTWLTGSRYRTMRQALVSWTSIDNRSVFFSF